MYNPLLKLKSKFKTKDIIPWLWLAFGYFWTIWYQIFRGQEMLDSDMSSEMVQAYLLNQERSLLCVTPNWIYSTELRFFNMQWIYRIGLALSPHNWHIARSFSMAIAIALLVFAVWLLFYAIGESRMGIWAAAMTIFPGGAYHFWQTIYAGFYLPYILISLFSLSLSLLAIRNIKHPRHVVYIVAVICLGLLSGLNGIKQLMIFYPPFVLTAATLLIIGIHSRDSEFIRERIYLLAISVFSTLSSVIGYAINVGILSKVYQFAYYGDTTIDPSSFSDVVREFIWCYGFTYDKPFMSAVGLASMCGVLIGLSIVFSIFRLLCNFTLLSSGQRVIYIFSAFSILFCCFVFSYIEHGYEYLKILVPIGYCLIVLEMFTERFVFSRSRHIVCNIVMIVLLITSLGTVYNESHEPIMHPYRAQPNLNSLVTWLRGGYDQGVSLFWTSNIVTELSDGDIEMWSLKRHPEYKDDWLDWETKKSHIGSFPEGKYFYLVDNKEINRSDYGDEYAENRDNFLNEHPGLIEIYSDDEYTVYANEL